MLLREVLRRICAAAGGRCTTAARVRACAHARGRATAACAEARARAARAYLLRAQREAAAAAGPCLRKARDSAMRVAYGESPPKIPSTLELVRRAEQLMLDIVRLVSLGNKLKELHDLFNLLSPYNVSFILAIILTPIMGYYQGVIPTAPETVCPFLGIRSLGFDEFPVEEGLVAVLLLCARSGGFVMLCAGCLCICACLDIGTLVLVMVGKKSYQIRSSGDELRYSEVTSVEWGM